MMSLRNGHKNMLVTLSLKIYVLSYNLKKVERKEQTVAVMLKVC